jgi:uncharacterized protein YjbJ (UPF0337 family)
MEGTVLHLKRPWNEVRDRIKETYVELTDEDLDLQPGKEDEMLEQLEPKLNKSKEAIKVWIESVSSNKPQAG